MDFLTEIVNERTRRNPAFPNLVAEAEDRRAFARTLAEKARKSATDGAAA